MADPFDPGHLFGHVQDSDHFELPRALGGEYKLPQPLMTSTPIVPGYGSLQPLDLKLTKFMVLEVVAAILVAAIFIRLANLLKSGKSPTGRFWNLFEAMVLFIRDQVARPAIGKHDAHRFLPFLWTLFFFVLMCNLLGLLPRSGSATGALATTASLAVVTMTVVVGSGMAKLGPLGFWKAQVPHMELPSRVLGFFLWIGIFCIEVMGLFIRHIVLAVRLLANMMAGHIVLAVIVGFIAASWGSAVVYGVAPITVLGAVALSMLELFVAFLQAYIFTFLAALFIGMAVHPH